MKTFINFGLVAIFTILTFSASAQFRYDQIETRMPHDSAVITGKLDNGLTYYIRQNEKPEKRVEFRLVVNAGSVLEDDDQQGLAHFLEHMAFNGTEDFSKNDLIDFLEKSGLNFGADLNAYTSFDETVYMFQMPSDRQGLLDSAFLVLENWAHKLSLVDEEIDKERGVVHEEWRLGLGAQDRMMKEYIPIILKDSRYAKRLPIGKMSVIDSCDYETVRRFYRDWYRPDLMAVIVVGDIDTTYAKNQIIEHFSKLENPEVERPRTKYNIPPNGEPLVAITSDKEATRNGLAIFRKLPKFTIKTHENYRRKLVLDLYVAMLNERIFEVTQDPEAPFTYAGADYGGFLARSSDAFTLYAGPKENKDAEAIELLINTHKRVKRYGFTAAEMERSKAQVMSRMEKALEEKDKTDSKRFVNEYVSNFLEHEAFPSINYQVWFANQVLPGIKLDEVNQIPFYIGKNDNLIVLLTGPEKEGVDPLTEEDVLAAIKAGQDAELEAYTEEAVQKSLITETLVAGTVSKASSNKDFGTTELKLSNGVTVVLKPTEFKNDEILMKGYGFGGTSLASDDDFISANFATEIISMSGIGNFDNIALKKFLTGKNVSVNAEIRDLDQGISGNSVKKDLETMFQLAYLHFTSPRKDTKAFQTFQSQMLTQFKFVLSNPQAVFYDTLFKLATQNDPRTIVIPTEEQINSIDLDKAYTFYKDRFSNAAGFTFVIVGSFDVKEITPLVAKYLGSLPSTAETSEWKDVSPVFPSGITKATINKGTEPKSSVALMMDMPFEWTGSNRTQMSMLMKILNIRMRESMREDQGGVYGVRSRPTMSKYPKEEINIMVSWGCSPDNVNQLVQTVFAEMDTLKMNGPTEINLGKAKETSIRDYETNFEKNGYWLNKIKNAYYYKEDLKSLDQAKQAIREITIQDLQKMAKTYFKDDHYLSLILMPEEE